MKKLFLSFVLVLFASSAFSLPQLLEKQSYKVRNIEDLAFDLIWEELEIQQSNEPDSISIEIYCNKEKYAPKIKSSGSSIYVKSTVKNFISLGTNVKCTVIARIPSNTNIEKFKMSTTSGNISADYIYSEKLVASSTSGSISVNGFNGEKCTINSTSGKIKLVNANTEEAKLTSTSGSITLEGIVSQAFDISSTSGTIGIELNTVPDNNSRATATSGTIFVGIPGDSNFSLNVQTTSGSFTNAFTKETIGYHVSYKADINNGGPKIILSSTSGRITVDSTNGVITNNNNTSAESDIPVVSFDDPIF